jgi:ubiquinone/menaquinone biosynthesis C-methylase UbiE
MHDRQFPASEAYRLDNPERLLCLPPAEVIGALAVRPGETVADVGAGTGYFSLPLAQAVGAQGKIYAVDAQPEMLALLRQKFNESGPFNIETLAAEAERTGLPVASCDRVFLANVWHEFADCAAVLRESARILKPGGRIAILDWRPDVERIGGPPLDHRLDSSNAAQGMSSAGFQRATSMNVGRYSWLVMGEKPL